MIQQIESFQDLVSSMCYVNLLLSNEVLSAGGISVEEFLVTFMLNMLNFWFYNLVAYFIFYVTIDS